MCERESVSKRVCVCERERERKRESECERERVRVYLFEPVEGLLGTVLVERVLVCMHAQRHYSNICTSKSSKN